MYWIDTKNTVAIEIMGGDGGGEMRKQVNCMVTDGK